MSDITTIRLHKRTKEHLDGFKLHPREPYEDVLKRIMNGVRESELGDPRRKALEDFRDRMERGYGHHIRRMIVYGSYARGQRSEGSDVDVLIIWTGEGAAGRKAAADVATQILVERGILISPKLVSPEGYEEMLRLGVPFARNVEKEGIQIG